jgi:hypothetical protein
LEGLEMENVGIYKGHLEYVKALVLVYSVMKNMATLE